MRNIQMNHPAHTREEHRSVTERERVNEHSQWKHQPSSEILTRREREREGEGAVEIAARGREHFV